MTAVAVAAPHAVAVDAAEAAVRAGGNALDAALAAAAVLTVAYPHQCSIGGDLTALVRAPDGTVTAVLSLGAAPAAIDVEGLRAAGGGMPGQGPHAVTVPGVVAGWVALAELGAALGLAAPLARAATLADDGTPVVAGLARAIADHAQAVAADRGLRALLMPDGWALAEGDLLRQPALAATLRALAIDPMSFYRGAVADRLSAGLAALGSAITAADLAAHAAQRPAPLTLDQDGMRWWAAPPPAQGATALGLLDATVPGDLLARAREAHAARARLLGDPRGGPIDVEGLRHPMAADAPAPPAAPATGDTVAVTAVDADGRSVALIQSVFQTFGAGLLEPDTGIVLHNRGGAFTLLADPAAHAAHPARLAPGHRPPHTLCPLLAESEGACVALGCQGGRAQPLILAQVAAGAADPGAPLAVTLAARRWVVGDRDLGFATETILAEHGADVPPVPDLPRVDGAAHEDRCGHVQVARVVDGRLEAAADPRADGRSAVVATPSSVPDRP